jgi:hypothetical protein
LSVREKDVAFRTVGQASEEEIEAATLRSIEALVRQLLGVGRVSLVGS